MNSTDELFAALERCAANSSKKAKLAIIQDVPENLRTWLKWAVDPTIAFYVAKLPKYERSGTSTLCEDDELLLRRLSTRELSGNDALERIKETMHELTPESQQLLRRILLKDLRCGVGETIINEAFPGLIPVFPYMRCTLPKDSNIDKWNWADGIYVQLKADGMFANVEVADADVAVYTRAGSKFPTGALGELEACLGVLSDGTQTHGELLVAAGGVVLERQIGNGILNSLLQGGDLPAGHEVQFMAWDQIPLGAAVDKGRHEVPYGVRLQSLKAQLASMTDGGPVWLIDTQMIYSRADAMKIYRNYLAAGQEGVIAKHPQAIWRDGDNKDQVKLKLEVCVDLRIDEILPGNEDTRNAGRPGRLRCSTSDDLLKVSVTVKNEAMRDALEKTPELFLSKVMPVIANDVMAPTDGTQPYSLFLPRFAEAQPRVDKSEADSLQRVKAQFEAAVAA
jgi:DNA ligase-1